MWGLQRVSTVRIAHVSDDSVALSMVRSGAKGNAKPKPCVKCDGKGWTMVTTAVSNLFFV